jgi:hypothetical protein
VCIADMNLQNVGVTEFITGAVSDYTGCSDKIVHSVSLYRVCVSSCLPQCKMFGYRTICIANMNLQNVGVSEFITSAL